MEWAKSKNIFYDTDYYFLNSKEMGFDGREGLMCGGFGRGWLINYLALIRVMVVLKDLFDESCCIHIGKFESISNGFKAYFSIIGIKPHQSTWHFEHFFPALICDS